MGGDILFSHNKKHVYFIRFNITVPLVRQERTSQPLTQFVSTTTGHIIWNSEHLCQAIGPNDANFTDKDYLHYQATTER